MPGGGVASDDGAAAAWTASRLCFVRLGSKRSLLTIDGDQRRAASARRLLGLTALAALAAIARRRAAASVSLAGRAGLDRRQRARPRAHDLHAEAEHDHGEHDVEHQPAPHQSLSRRPASVGLRPDELRRDPAQCGAVVVDGVVDAAVGVQWSAAARRRRSSAVVAAGSPSAGT